MKITKKLLLAVVGLVTVGSLGCSRWHHKDCDNPRVSEWGESYLYKKLELTEAQKSKFKDLIAEFNSSQVRIENERARIHREFARLFESETFEKAKALALIEESKAMIDKESKAFIPKFEVAHSKLNKEQKRKLAELVREYSKKE